MKYLFQIVFFFILSANGLQVAANNNSSLQPDSIAPKVFMIGEYENDFDRFSEEYQTSLISVCRNDMNLAFSEWVTTMRDIEKYSEKIGYDLKGVQMWVNVFWSKSGKIDHIAYYLKPKSRNVNKAEIETLLTNFASFHKFSLPATTKFSHYGGVSFPISQGLPVGN